MSAKLYDDEEIENFIAKGKEKLKKLQYEPRFDSFNEHRALFSLAQILIWTGKNGYLVEFSAKKANHFNSAMPATIVINTRKSFRSQLFFFLHEIGHLLLGLDDRRFIKGWQETDKKKMKLNGHPLAILDEEFEAWRAGWNFGLKKKFVSRSDYDAYEKLREDALMSYVRWAALPRDKRHSIVEVCE